MPEEPSWKVRLPSGETAGPFTVEELCEQIALGNVEPDSFARQRDKPITRVKAVVGEDRCLEALEEREAREQQEIEEGLEELRLIGKEAKETCPLGDMVASADQLADNYQRTPKPFCCGCGCGLMTIIVLLLTVLFVGLA